MAFEMVGEGVEGGLDLVLIGEIAAGRAQPREKASAEWVTGE